MDKPAVQDKEDCWICFNNENNVTLTAVDSERILKSCETYLDISIITKSFENDTSVSCCSCCYESTRQLISLEEQVEKLQKEISEVSSVFSKNVLQQRSRLRNEMGNDNNSILRTEKCFESPDDYGRHAVDTMGNVMVKKEVIEFTSKEFPADSQGNTKGNDSDVSDPWFETYDTDNPNNEECATTFYSEAEIDVKYSYDEVSTRAFDSSGEEIETNQAVSETNSEEHQQTKTTSMALGKYLKMPNIHLKGLLCDTSRNSAKSVADEENIKCEMAFDDSSEPYNYSKTISKELPFKCREISCSKSFKSENELAQHHNFHFCGRKLYKCSLCSKSFRGLSSLKYHERTHSGEKPYKCSSCSKSFTSQSNLRKHQIIHSEERPYKCSFCSKSFRRLSNAKQHEAIHSRKKPYKCSSCDKTYRLQAALHQHERLHTGERNVNCSFCSKSFLYSTHLKIHERIHTGERPFNCSFCSNSFMSSSDLNRHEMIHTGYRPHKCSFCSKSFNHSSAAKQHEMIHTGERPHKCSSCEKTFIKRSNLKIHYHRMHRDEENKEEFILP